MQARSQPAVTRSFGANRSGVATGSRLRVVLLGYGVLAAGLARGLLAAHRQCELVAVLRWPSRAGGDRHDAGEREFRQLVRDAGIEELAATRANGSRFEKSLSRLRPDFVLVGAWGEILGPRILECGPRLVNCHPSLLPRHRGANPYTSAILAGDASTGVSFHLMDTGVDTGSILLQERVTVEADDTGGSLRERCAAKATAMVPRLLDLLSHREPLPTAPQSSLGTPSRCARLKVADAALRWSEPASKVCARVRAVQPWLMPRTLARTRLGRLRLRVSAARHLGPGSAPPAAAAGTVLGVTPDGVRVASADKGVAVELEPVTVELAGLRLPRMLSRLMLPALVTTGTVLVDPPVQS